MPGIIWQLELVFYERGPPIKLLIDIGVVFFGEIFSKFVED